MTRRLTAVAVLLAALALPAAGEDKPAAKKPEPDPAATKLFAEARAARAQWEDFPGFRAKLEINVNGKVTKATVEVGAKGKVTVEAPGADAKSPALAWAKEQLGSVVGHRLGGAGPEAPCAFLDDDKDNPLGRAVRVVGDDDFHSSYRIRDNQLIVVNRKMKDSRFSIVVLDHQLNEEKKYLPVSYVVTTWDAKEALKSTQAFHQSWQRVGKYDLPASVTEVTALPGAEKDFDSLAVAPPGKQSARSLKLSEFELLK